jgi:signal transduction histidine kinase
MFDQSDIAQSHWDLSGHGLQRVALARVSSAHRVGALAVFFADPNAELSATRRAMFEYLAAATGSLAWARPDSVPDQFGVVAAAVPDGLAVLDRDGIVRSWNPAAHQLIGQGPVDVIGRPIPFRVPAPGQVLETRVESGRWLEVRSSSLGPGEQRVVTFRDVTAPRMENEGRDLFLTTTSHELRTPLTVVKGYADTLANRWDDLDDATRLTAVEAIRDRTQQLAALVDRLLLANRSAAGAVAMDRAPFDLRAALMAAVRAAPDPSHSQCPVFDAPDFLPWARGDRRSIGMIVNELLTNADKYSPVGGEVQVVAAADASSVYFQVLDRGIGVKPEHMDAVFDRFWQADQGDQRRYGGVGLGLYIIRRLLDRQGGWVSLRPRQGGGTVVEVRFPRADPLTAPDADGEDRSGGDPETTPDGGDVNTPGDGEVAAPDGGGRP